MGKRSGVTKSGRVMNPADRERKQNRLKELKRNKKERVKIRHTIVKSRDPGELIEHLEKLDDQEFDPQNMLSANVIAEKRTKYRGAFIQMIALYRTEKNEREVKSLESMLHEYELERFKKEQHYKALLFSESTNPDEIPLPTGSMAPNAALTPYAAPPVAPQFHPTMKSGILKKGSQAIPKKHKYPPGPPCGLPPSLSDEEDGGLGYENRARKVKFSDANVEEKDDNDYGPVEIPDCMLAPDPQLQNYGRMPPPRAYGVPIPPGMAPPPPRMFQPAYQGVPNMPLDGQYDRGMGRNDRNQQFDASNPASTIAGAPQVSSNDVETEDINSDPVIMGAPQMRNLTKETTRFVPTTLRVSRPTPPVRKVPPNSGSMKLNTGNPKQSGQPQTGKSTDQACDEFLREIQDLL